MQKHIPKPIYALQGWSIEQRGEKFYVAPTARTHDKKAWRGPYVTLQRATTAIARKLGAEWQERDKRRREFHRITKGPVR